MPFVLLSLRTPPRRRGWGALAKLASGGKVKRLRAGGGRRGFGLTQLESAVVLFGRKGKRKQCAKRGGGARRDINKIWERGRSCGRSLERKGGKAFPIACYDISNFSLFRDYICFELKSTKILVKNGGKLVEKLMYDDTFPSVFGERER